MFLIFDTETTGLPKDFNAPIEDLNNWPRLVQLAWQLHDEYGNCVDKDNIIIKPKDYTIPFNSAKIHGITTEVALQKGIPLEDALFRFEKILQKKPFLIGHNIQFDINIVGSELFRTKRKSVFLTLKTFDTKDFGTNYCKILGGRGGNYKWPTLIELHKKLFDEDFESAHNAAADVAATARSFLEMIRIGLVPIDHLGWTKEKLLKFQVKNDKPFDSVTWSRNIGLVQELKTEEQFDIESNYYGEINKENYFHLHNHTSYSVLSAATKIEELVHYAVKLKMKAVGITDLGNMMGSFQFLSIIDKFNLSETSDTIIGVVGCEYYVSERYLQKKFTKDNPDFRTTQVLLAKNKKGYYNLAKLSSIGYVDGYYAGFPRINKELILRHKENVIALTGGIKSEIPNLILNVGETQAEEAFKWWHNAFGDDFYVELIRHGLEEEDHVNKILLKLAKKYNVPYIPQNNTYYLHKQDSKTHDILLCIREGENKSTPIGKGRGFRYGFPNDEFYFKSQIEMTQLFQDLPESFNYLESMLDKFENYTLERNLLLPKFQMPKSFDIEKSNLDGENAYLRHITFQGAQIRFGEVSKELEERLNFELETIKRIGYPGYFLIVQDICKKAREMGVIVGPGRGSAAGSAVAYCIGITSIDPIKYNLLFERFLNPERVSLPDIDIDFDDNGRDKIIEWVVDKYGYNQVAQIITFGKMGGKSAIRDTARTLGLPLAETDIIAKKMPSVSLKSIIDSSEDQIKDSLSSDELVNAMAIKKLSKRKNLEGKTLKQASKLEGIIRNTGIHACGIIISPKDLREIVPLAVSKDSTLLCTQFDNSSVEKAGLLKMDFLGLKTLTLIKDTCASIRNRFNIDVKPDEIPLDDIKTLELFQRGETIGVFQYESIGMQRYLKQLLPDSFEDLIAMNALYRPGPIKYIPNFIARKHGKENIEYDLPVMKSILKPTYGITVYQEQVMILSQLLANFTKGQADQLRKGMGKKIHTLLNELKSKFVEGGKENGHPEFALNKIWKDWEAFAEYAFNKSHSTCYAYVAFHTAYLKSHYPEDYMASVLSNNMDDIKQVTFFMEECKRMNIDVLGPDVNESRNRFVVNKKNQIRFGMGAIKGMGSNTVKAIVEEREKNGPYKSVFDMAQRLNLRSVNKKSFENLAQAGAFDSFKKLHRAQYIEEVESKSYIEDLLRLGSKIQREQKSSQLTLFDQFNEDNLSEPIAPKIEPWSQMKLLQKEKEVTGFYISGHPLDEFKYEIKYFTKFTCANLANGNLPKNFDLTVAGIICAVEHKVSNKGNEYGVFTLEDYSGTFEFKLFGESYLKFKHFLQEFALLHLRVQIVSKHQSDDSFIKINEIRSLHDVLSHYPRQISIGMQIDNLNEKTLYALKRVLKKNKGKVPYKIKLYEKEKPIQLSMKSKRGLKINKNVLEVLNDFPIESFELL